MKFSDLVGKTIGFCGVDNNAFCVVTPEGERLAFEAIEDESDGYRSMLQEVKEVPLDGLIFFSSPIASLIVEDVDDEVLPEHCGVFDGYRLVDIEDGRRWLLLGTSNNDDYYPCFTVSYDPPRDVCVVHEDCRSNAEMAKMCAAGPPKALPKKPRKKVRG